MSHSLTFEQRLKNLAEDAQMMPWESSIDEVPHSARWAFQQAITADHYLALLKQRADLVELLAEISRANSAQIAPVYAELARAAIAKTTGAA